MSWHGISSYSLTVCVLLYNFFFSAATNILNKRAQDGQSSSISKTKKNVGKMKICQRRIFSCSSSALHSCNIRCVQSVLLPWLCVCMCVLSVRFKQKLNCVSNVYAYMLLFFFVRLHIYEWRQLQWTGVANGRDYK